MQRKILYFINPISGTKNITATLELIKKRTTQQQIPFNIAHTNAEGNYLFLPKKITTEAITDIVVCGGDGTVSQVAAALLGIDINIGIIPMGSGNGLALAAKIPAKINKALDIIFTGKAAYVDSFYLNDKFSCMLCGMGLDAQVAHDFAKQSSRGLATYIKQSVRNFILAKPYPFTIINKGNSFLTDAYFISIANSNQFGNQLTIAPKASLQDGLLDIVVVKKMPKLRMLVAVITQILAGEINNEVDKTFHQKELVYFQTDRLCILNTAMAPLHIDGDPAKSQEKIVVKIIPRAFKLIQPYG